MKSAFLFLATGFEEIEALATVDILRRGGVRVTTVSITGQTEVMGAHNIPVIADATFEEAEFQIGDAFILPGGIPGSNHLNTCTRLKELIMQMYKEEKLICAVCAAPMVLGSLGLLKNKRATCFPYFEPTMIGAIPCEEGVVQDGNIITAKGPGFVFDFALCILKNLRDEETAKEVAEAILV